MYLKQNIGGGMIAVGTLILVGLTATKVGVVVEGFQNLFRDTGFEIAIMSGVVLIVLGGVTMLPYRRFRRVK